MLFGNFSNGRLKTIPISIRCVFFFAVVLLGSATAVAAPPYCGDGKTSGGEVCDPTGDDSQCPGMCVEPGPPDECTCPAGTPTPTSTPTATPTPTPTQTPPGSAIDPNAAVVLLRHRDLADPNSGCGPAGSELPNCFESMLELSAFTTGWIWTTRQPDASSPLVVDIGPGSFGEFQCPNIQVAGGDPRAGYVSVRGAGRGITVLDGQAEIPQATGGIFALNCTHLSFSHLTAVGPQYGVRWGGGGDATWTDVDLETYDPPVGGIAGGWFDQCDFGNAAPGVTPLPSTEIGELSRHFFFGSRVRTFGAVTLGGFSFVSQCGDSWFYGGDIELTYNDPAATILGVAGGVVTLLDNGQLRAFGTSIRGTAKVGLSPGSLRGVRVRSSSTFPQNHPSQFHIHGGIISLNVSTADTSVIGIEVTDDGQQPAGANSFAHTLATAYVLNPSGTGTVTRILTSGGGVAQSPLLWQAGDAPPASTNADLVSEDGEDLFVETDCYADGDCDTAGGNQSHLMVYDADCATAGPWRDSTTGRCRGDTGP
jgi:hypothetical protein